MKIKWLRAAARFAAAVFVLLAVSFTVGCPLNRLTGLKCPGCGVTRMILRILHLDFKTAFFYNPAIFCLVPLWAAAFCTFMLLEKSGKTAAAQKVKNTAVYFSIAVLVFFGVVRNILPLGFPA